MTLDEVQQLEEMHYRFDELNSLMAVSIKEDDDMVMRRIGVIMELYEKLSFEMSEHFEGLRAAAKGEAA